MPERMSQIENVYKMSSDLYYVKVGGKTMRSSNFKKRNIGRRNIAVVLCVFLLTTSMATTTGNSFKTSDQKPITSTIEIPRLQILDDSTESLSYSFLFTEPSLKETKLHDSDYTKITMPGTMTIGKKAGAPAMPVKIVKLLLPPKKQVTNINVLGEPVEMKMNSIDLRQKPVIPYQKPIPVGSKVPRKIDFDNTIYTLSNQFPKKIYDDYSMGLCRGYTILSVALNPVQYLPSEGRLFCYPEITINIELEESNYNNQFYRDNQDDEEWVKKLVYNPEMTESYKYSGLSTLDYPGGICDPSDDYDYVIVTTAQNGLDHWETTVNIPYNWTSLMDKHEADDGLVCTLVTIQDIDACVDYHDPDPLFNDLEAHIREFCKDAYQDWGTDYIFVGGDDEWIPARHMKYDYESNVDSDIYWSNLDLTFNADGDSYWGEEGDTGFDLYAELFIGRITCDIPQDVSNWMKKSFYYADSTFKDYLDNAAFYGGNTGWNCEGDDFVDYGAIKGTDNWLGPIPGAHGAYPSWLGFQYGFETWNSRNPGMEYDLSVKWTAEPPNPGWQGGSESVAINGLRAAINDDQCTLISALAHAHEGMSMDVTSSNWESQYHNTMPFFVTDMGCHCGDMDAADDGVLHSMLFHSDTELAFACVYNTGYGWGSFDDTNSSSAMQMKCFWDYLFDVVNNSLSTQNWQLGKAQAWSKDAMAPTIDWTYDDAPGSWRGVIQGCLLFGDPAQLIKPPEQPEHNIGIQEFDVPSHEPADTDIWVGATLYNNGKHDETNIEIRFLIDDVEVNSTTIPLFEKNGFETVGWWYHTPTYGWETMCVNVTVIPGENITLDNIRCQDVIYGPDIAVTDIQAPEYLGQGFPQEVKGYVENLGPTDEIVTVEFYANELIEESTVIDLTSGSGTWVTFLWDGTNSGLGTYDVVIHAVPVPDEYYLANQNKSATVTVFAAIGNILLVDDDDGDSYETWYENALLASNYVYDVWDRTTQGSPSPATMQGYTAVIWFTGLDYGTTLSTTDQSNLATYLDNGGKLFISGQDIGYDIGSTSFYTSYLHASYNVDTAGWEIQGQSGDVIGDGLSFSINSGDGANNQNWPDGIQPVSPAVTCFSYSDDPPYKGGIHVEVGAYRIVYLAFGFEGIDNMDDRVTVMSRILGWLAADHDIAVLNLDVPSVVPYNELTTVEASIRNMGINDETSIVVHFLIEDIIQDSTTIEFLGVGQTEIVSFPWIPTEVGTFDVSVEAEPVPDEDILFNNELHQWVEVDAYVDAGVTSITSPEEIIPVGECTIMATIENFGDLVETVPVNCSLYSSEGLPIIEDFDDDNAGYTPSGPTDIWEWGIPTDPNGPETAHSGEYCWGTNLDGSYGDNANALLDSVPIFLPENLDAALTFWHWYNTEAYWDGGNVKISTDNGDTWTVLGTYLDPYNEDAAAPENQGIPGEPCFSGHGQHFWEQVTFDLSEYAGEEIILRWHFGSDDTISWYPGWYIDDVIIEAAGELFCVYSAEENLPLEPGASEVVEFLPPWDATPGRYLLEVTTRLSGDEYAENNVQNMIINVVLPGDLDYDGDVDLSDLSQLLAHYGTMSGATYDMGDLDGDGDVDLQDLATLLAYYGYGT